MQRLKAKTTVQQNPILEKVSVLHLSLEILQNIDINIYNNSEAEIENNELNGKNNHQYYDGENPWLYKNKNNCFQNH